MSLIEEGKDNKVLVQIDLFKVSKQILNPFVLIIIGVRMSIKKKIERSLEFQCIFQRIKDILKKM